MLEKQTQGLPRTMTAGSYTSFPGIISNTFATVALQNGFVK